MISHEKEDGNGIIGMRTKQESGRKIEARQEVVASISSRKWKRSQRMISTSSLLERKVQPDEFHIFFWDRLEKMRFTPRDRF